MTITYDQFGHIQLSIELPPVTAAPAPESGAPDCICDICGEIGSGFEGFGGQEFCPDCAEAL